MHNAGSKRGVSYLVITAVTIIVLVTSATLLSINLYGLTQNIRMPGLAETGAEDLRFVLDEGLLSYRESIDRIDALSFSGDYDAFASEVSGLVNRSLVHLDWEEVDPAKYRQLIPIWENYFLYFLGRYSGMPQIERYHYSDYRRNLKRGIGICGDASTILSSILDEHGIANDIISFDGHVLVQYYDEEGAAKLIDPDFDVSLGISLTELGTSLEEVYRKYLNEGYSDREIGYLLDIYEREYLIFDNTYHFMSKRYIFESVSYYLKWIAPLAGLVLSIAVLYWVRRLRAKVW